MAAEPLLDRAFLEKLSELDQAHGRFGALVWDEFPRSIRVLLDNPYVFADFWKAQSGVMTEEAWKESFAKANRAAHVALGKQDTVTVLSIVLSRIYTLRNQLLHGGATWQSSVNRDQSDRRASSARASSGNGPPACPGPRRRPSGSSHGMRMNRSSTMGEGPTGGSVTSLDDAPRSRSRPLRSTMWISARYERPGSRSCT